MTVGIKYKSRAATRVRGVRMGTSLKFLAALPSYEFVENNKCDFVQAISPRYEVEYCQNDCHYLQ